MKSTRILGVFSYSRCHFYSRFLEDPTLLVRLTAIRPWSRFVSKAGPWVLFPVSVFVSIFEGGKPDGLKDSGQPCNRRSSGESCQNWGPTCV